MLKNFIAILSAIQYTTSFFLSSKTIINHQAELPFFILIWKYKIRTFLYLPAIVVDDPTELFLIFAVVGVTKHVFIVTVVVNILIFRNNVHI